jgi:hypothetical protein
VDLANVVAYTVTIDAPAAGDYHTTLIQIPVSATSPAMGFGLIGTTATAGPPYPSPPVPIRVSAQPPLPIMPLFDIEFSIMDATNAVGQILANVVGGIVTPGDPRVFLTTFIPGGPTHAILQYRFDYALPAGGDVDGFDFLTWQRGETYFEMTVSVAVEEGTTDLTLFGEIGLEQPISLTDVTTMAGSTLLTLEVTGPVDGTKPALNMTLGGEFTPTAAVPVFAPGHWAPLMLAGLVMVGALVLVTRARRRGTARL